MEFEKAEIVKEDGRYLIFYHFPASANHDQNEAFRAAKVLAEIPKATIRPTHGIDDGGADTLSGKDGGVV